MHFSSPEFDLPMDIRRKHISQSRSCSTSAWFQLKVGEPLFGFIYGEIIVIFTRVMAIENISDPRKPKLWGFEDTVSKCVLLFHVHV